MCNCIVIIANVALLILLNNTCVPYEYASISLVVIEASMCMVIIEGDFIG